MIKDTTTPEQRMERSKNKDKNFRKMLNDLKKNVIKSYQNKAMHDAYYQRVDFKEVVLLKTQ